MTSLSTLLLQIVAVLVTARLIGALFDRLQQPVVVGEMAAGLMLGPSLAGRVAPGLSAWLFPPASLDLLNTFSQFGLVLFMFIVGSRLDPGHLQHNRRIVVLTSYVSMLLPFAMGIGVGFLLAPSTTVPGATLSFVLFVGLSLSITAFPVLVRIVDVHGLAGTRLGTIAVSCAAFDDVTAWVALALVTSLARTGAAPVGGTFARLAAYAALMLWVVRPVLRRGLRRLPEGEAPLIVLLVAALLSAAATDWIGIHALFGSFFLGALMSRDVADRRVRTERIEPLTVMLFVPVFFAFTGLRTNIQLLSSPRLVAQTIGILGVAIVGKAAGPLLTGRRLGLSPPETTALGVLLNTRGLVELVVLNIGLEAGLLSPSHFAMLTVMALTTTAMTSPLLAALGYPRR